MQTIYRPGQWYVIVLPGALVALPPDVSADALAQLWERMPGESGLAAAGSPQAFHFIGGSSAGWWSSGRAMRYSITYAVNQ